MGFVIVMAAVLAVITGVAGYAIRSIREIETLLPDDELASAG